MHRSLLHVATDTIPVCCVVTFNGKPHKISCSVWHAPRWHRHSGATWQLKVTGKYSCPKKVSYKHDAAYFTDYFLTVTVHKTKIRKTSFKRNKSKLCPTEHRTWASRSLLQKMKFWIAGSLRRNIVAPWRWLQQASENM